MDCIVRLLNFHFVNTLNGLTQVYWTQDDGLGRHMAQDTLCAALWAIPITPPVHNSAFATGGHLMVLNCHYITSMAMAINH